MNYDNNEQEKVPISVLNSMIGNVKNFYLALVDKGWYLPEYDRGSVTFSYLWDAFNGKCFRILRTEIKKGKAFKKVTKLALFQELNKIIPNIGFTSEKIPNMEWMIDVLNTLNPQNPLLSKEKHVQSNEPKVLVSIKYHL
jgi:hypothetical protein